MKLHTKIIVGLVAGVVLGGIAKLPGAELLQAAVVAVEPIGTIFIRLITMVVVPLVVASLFVGVASLGDVRRLGRIGGKTLIYFAGTTLLAATIGLTVARAAGIGTRAVAPREPERPRASAAAIARLMKARHDTLPRSYSTAPDVTVLDSVVGPTPTQSIIAMVPTNPFAAAASADLLPLIVAVCAFGAAAAVIGGEGPRAVITFFQGVNDLSLVIVGWLMQVAPVAVAVLVAATVAKSGVDLLRSLAMYALIVVAALLVHVVLVLIPVLRLAARLGVMTFFRAVSDALLLAFSTASSSATLPVSMAAARNRLGISSEIVSFMLPAGATLNKNGAAVYKAVTAVFIARIYGVPLDLTQCATIIIASSVAAFAGPGVPGSSLVTTMIVLSSIGLGSHAAEGIALVVGIDRPLDMCRSLVNTIGNLVGACVVARTEHEVLKS